MLQNVSGVERYHADVASYCTRRALLFCTYAALGGLAVLAADFAQELFNHTQAKVVDNLKRFPRYVCVQTVSRAQYQLPPAGSSCASAIANNERNSADRILRWHDRLRLDVAVGEKSDMYSWAGASQFESGDLSDIVSRGTSGSGEFASFLTGVFAGDAGNFRYTGTQDLPIGRVASFDFTVPIEKSHYRYSVDGKQYATTGYQGTFFVDPATADLRELDVDVNNFPQTAGVCRVQDKIEYTETKIGDDTFLLPSHSSMDVVYRNSTESENITTFSGCREYTGESTIRFDVDENGNTPEDLKRQQLKPLPPKTHIQVRIDPPIHSNTASAGDPITGVVTSPVKVKGVVLVSAGDKLEGRIVRLEQSLGRTPRWTVAIVFNKIVRSGVEEKITLKPDDDGDRSMVFAAGGRRAITPSPPAISDPRPAGGGLFVFDEPGELVLDRKFVSEWETR
ncbi:MAG TPA: hypothetical protein VHC90_17305 [Bryobacteraceae bacterium]|nr:hypothetical protein [Bryobacteraceae bacterium]